MACIYLSIVTTAEATVTSALKASDEFTKIIPDLVIPAAVAKSLKGILRLTLQRIEAELLRVRQL